MCLPSGLAIPLAPFHGFSASKGTKPRSAAHTHIPESNVMCLPMVFAARPSGARGVVTLGRNSCRNRWASFRSMS